MMNKLRYLIRASLKFGVPSAWLCPNCGASGGHEIDRKFFVTRLIRCDGCGMMYRGPTDSESFSHRFYNLDYVEGVAMICPSDSEIEGLKATNFAGTDRDFTGYVSFLRRHGVEPGARLLDFGCSWGYGSYQFANAGYDVYSYELAVDRRNYGIDKLGVRHVDDLFEIGEGHPLFNSFDCFFSAHVLEHVPAPSRIFDLAWRLLKPGGAFVAFTPNGNLGFRDYNRRAWSNMWGAVHPNYLDEVFYETHFARSRRVFGARDGGEVNKQYELGFIAVKDAEAGGF